MHCKLRNTRHFLGQAAKPGRAISCALVLLLSAGVTTAAESFETLEAELSQNTTEQPESAIIQLLESGIAENQPAKAHAMGSEWLNDNLADDSKVLYLLGRSAELSGNWRDAVASYQQFLTVGDPKSAEASEAILATFSALIHQLSDIDSAYAFSRLRADRLAVNQHFRQYDDWFFELSRSKRDLESHAGRLLALAKSGLSQDQYAAFYFDEIIWLLRNLSETRYDLREQRPSAEFINSVKELSQAIEFNPEISLLLDWKVSVLAYNCGRIDGLTQTDAPHAEAKALLQAYPEYAKEVQLDWAGSRRGQYYNDDPKKYWPHQLDQKTAELKQAFNKLNELQKARMMQTWSSGYYSRGPEIITPEQARELTLGQPELINQKIGPTLDFDWRNLDLPTAQKLAPKLNNNPSPQASAIRAIATVGESKDTERLMDELLGAEAWRIPADEFDNYADAMWHWAGRPGGNENRNRAKRRGADLAKTVPDQKALLKLSSEERLQGFRKLWKDYTSPSPKIPSVLERIEQVLLITPEAMKELLGMNSPEARFMASRMIGRELKDGKTTLAYDRGVDTLSPQRYNPYLWDTARRWGSWDRLKENKDLYVPHPLLPALQKALKQDIKDNALHPDLIMAWINAQFPEQREQAGIFMEKLIQAPGWKAMPLRVHYAARQHFTSETLPESQLAILESAKPSVICESLLQLNEDSDAPSAIAAVKAITQAMNSAPKRIDPMGLERLGQLSDEVWNDESFVRAAAEFIDSQRITHPNDDFGRLLLAAVTQMNDAGLMLRTAAYHWNVVERFHRTYGDVMQVADNLSGEKPEVASALARMGLQAIERKDGGHTWFNRETDVPKLKSIRGNAAMAIGLIDIPVPPSDASYPVYLSQAEWVTDNIASAWKLLDANWEEFLSIHRKLTIPYVMWALQRSIDTRNETRQEALITALLDWSDEASSPLDLTEKAEIEIAYGDIAMQRGQLRQAHEIYQRTAQKEAYAELMVSYTAILRKAAAERVAKDFDAALQTLSELELERVSSLWVEIRYARALIYFEMEEFDDAKDDVESILSREPNHPDSKILLGKIQLKREKLMEATEVELGATTSQQSLVPGENLKVTLTDPTLAVSGAGTEIEVVVWTTTGDREQFFLRQFGDQKTKFRGEVATALGAPASDDGTLQVIGDDEIYYAFSERFREKMNNLEAKQGGPIRVASDALLMASARKLLSAAEQRRADMQGIMESIEGSVTGDVEGAARAKLASQALESESSGDVVEDEFGRYLVNVAKPGNPIHVRVIDPDRSRTPEIDELTVSVSTSSGDLIGSVTLTETGTHTGWFEASIPTASAQAIAFARNSESGRNPNMVISPEADSYPAWRPVPIKGTTPEFKIDLNDNAAIDELVITAKEEGARIEKFALETGMDEGVMETVAAFPQYPTAIEKPWHPSVLVMNDTDYHHNRNERSVYDLQELREQVRRGWMTQTYDAGVAENVSGPSEAMNESIPAKVKWLRQNRHHNSHVIYRFRGYFYEPRQVTRRFRLDLGKYEVPEKTHSSVAHPAQFLVAVNGRPITDPQEMTRLEGEVELNPGIHKFEIWATGWDCTIGFGRTVQLRANLGDDDKLVDCPDRFFDPGTFPEESLYHRNATATVTANEAGTEFRVQFAPGSKARLLKLDLIENEGPVPALNKLVLTDPKGDTILPVDEDFAKLNRNDTLEMLTGDRITVRYRDDRFVTETKENQERFLSVSFTDARIEFADMEPRLNEGSQMMLPYYEKRIRFQHGEQVSVAIHDADMDTSVQPDKVAFVLSNDNGEEKRFEAIETGDSTGIFKLSVVPVSAAPQAPDQFQVAEGGRITATYTDEENNRPGVVTERVANIEHAAFVQPQFLIGHAEVSELEDRSAPESLYHGFQGFSQENSPNPRKITERVHPRWEIKPRFLPKSQAPEGGLKAVLGQSLYLELIAPQYLLGTNSKVTVYAQTESGRRAAQLPAGSGFDINTPGTVKLTGSAGDSLPGLRDWRKVNTINTYRNHYPWSRYQKSKDDRFRVATTVIPGITPKYGVLSETEMEELAESLVDSRSATEIRIDQNNLVAKPGDTIYFGFRFTGRDGQEQWETSTAKVVTHPDFDIMGEGYSHEVNKAYAGERLYLRVVDLGADVSDQIDEVQLLMQAKSGAKHYVTLVESGPHTGIFRDSILLSYSKDPAEETGERDVNREGFPITYGDKVAARYTDANGVSTETNFVTISKGADGSIAPFSKIYEDEDIAMRTQFSLAEAYLEMAKRHRKLGQAEKAEQEYESAKMLLAKAMDQFTDPETRAHAEYLLGTLTMEEADATQEPEIRETRFRAALSRFMTVTGSYPLTIHASRAQYRIATVYEKLGEPEIAAQEYVKLAYKYPDSEYLATSMARLGTHFLKKAAAYEQEAKPLLDRGEEDRDAAYEGEALQQLSIREYLKTASIFSRLQERFPSNRLAGPAGLRAGQAYMRADRKREAIRIFNQVIREESYDGPEVRAQAMYWIGMCYLDLREEMAAYSNFKRLTYDFPESKWASYARAQLSQERLLDLESDLELERLEAGK